MITDFKIGDEFIVHSSPEVYSSLLNKNSPLHLEIYPYKGIIRNIEKHYSHVAMTCGKYGWSLSHLIKNNLIEKIEKQDLILW